MSNNIDTIIFDLGKVLIDWNPRYVYDRVWPNDPNKFDYFISRIFTVQDNVDLDAGQRFADKIRELSARHPDWAEAIGYWDSRWEEMLGGAVEQSVAVLRKLKADGKYRLFALTNWSAEKFPIARARFPFLDECFADIIVSGEVKMVKPNPEIYRHAISRWQLTPERSLFIDDSPANVEAARQLGIGAIHFIDSQQLVSELRKLEIDV
ncbi:MAG: HAD family phosphatase [Negativicutes bacterium]|nr:HAD family phosphatase [Negativicutes bacterium]